MLIYIERLGIVSATVRKTYKYICQMHLSKNAAELDACIAANKIVKALPEGFLSA